MASIFKKLFKKKQKKTRADRINEILSMLDESENTKCEYKENILKIKKKNLKNKRLEILNKQRYNRTNKNNSDANKNNNLKFLNLNENDYINTIFKTDLNILYDSKKLYEVIKNKQSIPLNTINIIDVESNGNCYYNALSIFLYNSSQNHLLLRKGISAYCKDNQKQIIDFQPSVEIRKNKYISTEEYIKSMEKIGNWAVDLDIIITSFLFSINIAIYKYEENKEFLEYINFYQYEELTNNNPIFLLLNQNENHYLLGYPKNYNASNIIENDIENSSETSAKFNKEKTKSTNNHITQIFFLLYNILQIII